MKAQKRLQISRTIPFLIVVCLLGLPAHAQYGGGTGEPNDPYLIYTPAHLQAIGLDPNSWDKHFKLMSDLDMIAYQGASESETVRPIGIYSQRSFSGHFDGNGHTISHLTIRETGLSPAGLFGSVRPPLLSDFPWEAEAVEVISDLGLIDPNVQSPSNIGVGALIGYLTCGKVSSCYVKGGIVKGANRTGGLVGSAPSHSIPNPHALRDCYVQDCDVQGGSLVGGLVGELGDGLIDACWSVARVRGHRSVGGLAGMVETFWEGHGLSVCWSSGTVEGASGTGGLIGECRGRGWITGCYSTAAVQGGSATGGLVGTNICMIANCHSVAPVSGVSQVGGLVGVNQGTVSTCYAAGLVSGQSQVGGLIGSRDAAPHPFYPDLPAGSVSDSFWDTDTGGQTASAGGTGKTTAEMQTASTFLTAGWDFVGEVTNGTKDIWQIVEGRTYPRLWWEKYGGGSGTPQDPYQIATAADLILLGESPKDYDKHFILTADIDLDPNLPGGKVFDRAIIAPDTDTAIWNFEGKPFTGCFNGSGHTISHLTIEGREYLGLFGRLGPGAEAKDFGIVCVTVTGSSYYVGALAGNSDGSVIACYSTGVVSGRDGVGGLLGYNGGQVIRSHSTGTITGENSFVGGLVGWNHGVITTSHSDGMVSGDVEEIGGLVGYNSGQIIASCNRATVGGDERVGGLAGHNSGSVAISYNTGAVRGNDEVAGLVGWNDNSIATSYSVGTVSGETSVGGLVGSNDGSVAASFWDVEVSGQATSEGGRGMTTAAMQDIDTFLGEGWDFVDEVSNGRCGYWRISAGEYPQLHYHADSSPVMPEGLGTAEQPYLIRNARDLGTVWLKPTAYYRLEAPVDLSGITWSTAVVPWFGGTFGGDGYVISGLHIRGSGYLGLFGQLCHGTNVSNLCLEAVDVNGTGDYIGGLAGINSGSITASCSTGTVSGSSHVGGLVGVNDKGGIVTGCSTCAVNGGDYVGGLVGSNSYADVMTSYSTGAVKGVAYAGGLVGFNLGGRVASSYSAGTVSGDTRIGGLVGSNDGSVAASFWDVETSTVPSGDAGTGKTTAEMQTAATFLEAGWDFVGESANGTEDIWWILEGQDYPRLWWEREPGEESGPADEEPGVDVE